MKPSRTAAIILTLTWLFGAAVMAADSSRTRTSRQPDAGADSGAAHVLTAITTFPADPAAFAASITIDLRDVLVDGRAPVLGAYVAVIDFDADRVRIESVDGGDGPWFAAAPTSTNLERANPAGRLKLTAVQTDPLGPTRLVRVARAHCRELVPGGSSTVHVTLESLAAALDHAEDGAWRQNLAIPIAREDQSPTRHRPVRRLP